MAVGIGFRPLTLRLAHARFSIVELVAGGNALVDPRHWPWSTYAFYQRRGQILIEVDPVE